MKWQELPLLERCWATMQNKMIPMDCKTLEIFKLIIPGLIAIIGNMIFYWIIKGQIDKSIERHKVSYSGVFKEKIEIYKGLLQKVFELKIKIQKYQYLGQQEMGYEIKTDFNVFISYYLVNQPYLSKNMICNLKTIVNELQGCFDDFFMHNSLQNTQGIPNDKRIELLNKFFESGNKFKTNHPFKDLEDTIIAEMRKDLQIDKY
ncbi:MAG: hypothetical protein Q8928_03465 [Bacteroidota bacterium]|nr:hypothetical protein [Bacteroidota bacterium]